MGIDSDAFERRFGSLNPDETPISLTHTWPDEPPPTVKPAVTRKRPKREVETLDYIAAARRFIRAAGRRAGEGDEHELAAVLSLMDDLRDAIRDGVRGQRAHGKSWAAIAVATGTTREAAFQRWRESSSLETK